MKAIKGISLLAGHSSPQPHLAMPETARRQDADTPPSQILFSFDDAQILC
jgi:hypothetical protein